MDKLKKRNRGKKNSRFNSLSERMDILESAVLGPTGLAGTTINEMKPHYNKTEEQFVYNHKNSYLIFGRDRLASEVSGEGGSGGTRCDSIDLVTGLASAYSKDGPPDVDITVNPNVYSDAARIYLTQRGNIDSQFGLAKGGEDFSSKDRSAVAMKAQHCRIIGKSSVKIISGKAKMRKPGLTGEKNSQGGEEENTNFTIDFIAGNQSEASEIRMLKRFRHLGREKVNKLQPLVKGENLVSCLTEIYSVIEDICLQIEDINQEIIRTNRSIATHTHICAPIPLVATPTVIAPIIVGRNVALRTRASLFKATRMNNRFSLLNHIDSEGAKYINSKSVRTT